MGEIEDIIDRIQKNRGVIGLMVLDEQNAIVTSTFDDETGAKYQSQVPHLSYLARSMVRDIDPLNDLEFYRMRSKQQEIMIAAYSSFHLIVVQDPSLAQEI